jgi:hypothetical protein
MHVDFAFLADHANGGEKLNALGIGIDIIRAPEIPARVSLSFVAQIKLDPGTSQELPFAFGVLDASGQDAAPSLKGTLGPADAVPNPTFDLPDVPTAARIVIGLNISFPAYGAYRFRLTLQDQDIVELPLTVLGLPAELPSAARQQRPSQRPRRR